MASRSRTSDQSPEDNLGKIRPLPTESKYRAPVPDDDEIALELAEQLQDRLAYFHYQFYEYDGGYWGKRDHLEMYNRIRHFLRPYRTRGVKVKSAQIKSLISMMEADLYRPDRYVTEVQAEAGRYINMQNGMYDVVEHRLVEHRPELLLTNMLDFPYDPEAECPTFERFLNSSLVHPGTTETDYDMVVLLQQALGYSMTARTDLKSSFWLYGVPDSGKSTLLALMKSIMGSMAATIDLNQLGQKTFMLSAIIGKRIVSFSEASGNAMLPDALYKALVGGEDTIWADVKGKDAIEFKPIAKPWWAMNERPRISDRSGATFNRLKLFRFNRSFTAEEKDYTLLPKMIAERSGIFNRLMTFYKMLDRHGWQHVQQSQDLLEEYILENDTERSFVEECCERHELYKVQSALLYSRYSDWCFANGFKAKNRNQFAPEMRRLGFKDVKASTTMWHGLQLKRVEGKA